MSKPATIITDTATSRANAAAATRKRARGKPQENALTNLSLMPMDGVIFCKYPGCDYSGPRRTIGRHWKDVHCA